MDNNVYIFLHITLVTSLSTADLTPTFSEPNYIYTCQKWYELCSDSTDSWAVPRIIFQILDKNSPLSTIIHHYPALGKVQLSCLDDVLEKWCYKI